MGMGETATEPLLEEVTAFLAKAEWELLPEDLAGCRETARFLRRAAALIAEFEKDAQEPDP